MTTLATLLMTMIGPLVMRALLVVGFGTVTFVGVTAGLDSVISFAVASWSTLPASVLQLASLAGIPAGMGIICGAMVARLSVWSAISASKFIFNK